MTTAVVHLVRAMNGIAPFASFLNSYREHPAGIPHDLVFLWKGFDGGRIPAEFANVCGSLTVHSLFLPDRDFDIGPYFAAARQLEYSRFCFLNSYSEILTENWLAKLADALALPGVGAAGATGSWESAYSQRVGALKTMKPGIVKMIKTVRAKQCERWFPPFPNRHLRTNAFVIARETMLALEPGSVGTKQNVLRFEGGVNGMTRQLEAAGQRVVVVGRNGRAYESPEWYASETFRSGTQSNLLAADNQTRAYQDSGAERRAFLTELCWGTGAGLTGR